MVGEEEIRLRLTEPIAKEGYELVEVKCRKTKDGIALNIVVDRVAPIKLDEIVALSDKISTWLDELDPFEEGYVLDVSSLGAEKPIKRERLPDYIGSYVNLHLSHPYKGENILEGTIQGIQDGILSLEVKDKARKRILPLPLGDIDKARLAIQF